MIKKNWEIGKLGNWGIQLRHVILFAAVALGLAQFVDNKSLWIDDARIALNLMDMSYGELTGELRHNQSAPVGFLMVVKLLHDIAPGTEHAMKLFPFLAFVAAVFLFDKISHVLLENKHAANAALAVLAFNSAMLFFSSEIKQYASDVAVTLLISWLALRDCGNWPAKMRVLAPVGAVCVFFSNTAPFALAAAGVYVACEYLKAGFEKQKIINLAALATVWLVAFGVYYDTFVPPPESLIRRYMAWYWDVQNPAFVFAHGLRNSVFLIAKQMAAFMAFYFGNPAAIILMPLFALAGACVATFKKNRRVLIFTILPFAIHLAASAAELYPFATRFLVWCLPGFILLAAAPLDALVARAEMRGNMAWQLILTVFCAGVVPLASFAAAVYDFPVSSRQDVKSAISHVLENADFETERIIVVSQACYVYEYYARIGVVPDAMLAKSAGTGWDMQESEDVKYLLPTTRGRPGGITDKCWVVTVFGGGAGQRYIPQNSSRRGVDFVTATEKYLFRKKTEEMGATADFREREGPWKILHSDFGNLMRSPENTPEIKSDTPFEIPPNARLSNKSREFSGAGAYHVEFEDE